MICAKLIALLLGIISPTAQDKACCHRQDVTKPWEDGDYYSTRMYTSFIMIVRKLIDLLLDIIFLPTKYTACCS